MEGGSIESLVSKGNLSEVDETRAEARKTKRVEAYVLILSDDSREV